MGKWQISDNFQTTIEPAGEIGDNGLAIAFAQTKKIAERIVREHNAHAALVDALKMIRDEIESDEEEQSISFSTTALWFEILNQADAALALAEGPGSRSPDRKGGSDGRP